MIFRRIAKAFDRRAKRKLGPARSTITIWESELRAIAAETSAWSVETGGDLFGIWDSSPEVLLATRAGPNAQRNHAHFRLDVEYLRHLSAILARDWRIRYFGDWHSHHRLGLSRPSGGDQRRIVNLGRRNQLPSMAEIIVTIDDDRNESYARIHPWHYDLSTERVEPLPMAVKVLPGLSPIREALMATGTMPEQQFSAWQGIALDLIRVAEDASVPRLEKESVVVGAEVKHQVRERLVTALQGVSGNSVELHETAFGSVVVAQLKPPYHLAFAIGKNWPMTILEVHRLNRESGSTEIIETASDMNCLDINGVVKLFERQKAAREA